MRYQKTFLLAVLLIVISCLFIIGPSALVKKHINQNLKKFGIEHVKIESLHLTLNGFEAKNIHIDSDGFNNIKKINGQLNWLKFISTHHIKKIVLSDISITTDKNVLPRFNNITSIPIYEDFITSNFDELVIDGLIYDFSTSYGYIRLTLDSYIKRQTETQLSFQGRMSSKQFQFELESNWTGQLDLDEGVFLEGKINHSKINVTPLKINRASGWITAEHKIDMVQFDGEFISGSGKLFDLPLQNLELIFNIGQNSKQFIFDSKASGFQDIGIRADLLQSNQINSFSAYIEAKSEKELIEFYSTTKNKDVENKAGSKTPFQLSIHYLPERRFADGPFPFSLKALQNNKETLSGNFLIYPQDHEIRGTANLEKAAFDLYKSLFNKTPSQETEGVVRLDTNYQRFF